VSLPPLKIVFNSNTLGLRWYPLRNRRYGSFPTIPPHNSRVLWYFYPIWGPYDMKNFKSKKIIACRCHRETLFIAHRRHLGEILSNAGTALR